MNVCDLVCLYAALSIDSGALSLLVTTQPFILLEIDGVLPSLSLFEVFPPHQCLCDTCSFHFFQEQKPS